MEKCNTKSEENDFTYKDHLGYLKIYWYGILYCAINMEKFTGIQSWKHNGTYSIAIYTNGQMIHLEFNTADKWKFILDIFDNNI